MQKPGSGNVGPNPTLLAREFVDTEALNTALAVGSIALNDGLFMRDAAPEKDNHQNVNADRYVGQWANISDPEQKDIVPARLTVYTPPQERGLVARLFPKPRQSEVTVTSLAE